MSEARVAIPGSQPARKEQERFTAPVDPNQQISVTVVLKRGSDATAIEQALLNGTYQAASREQAEAAMSASPEDMEAVKSFVTSHGLNVTLANAASHEVRVDGSAAQMEDAFGVKLGLYQDPNGATHISYSGSITLPSTISPIVTAVLGLDQRPVARHASR